MAKAYYNLYKRAITRKDYSEELITEYVDDAHNKGRLTDGEYDELVALIDKVYGKSVNPTEE